MKINCGPTREEYLEQQAEWHDHFAWWPRKVDSQDCRWLETVQRRRIPRPYRETNKAYWITYYRAKPTP